ncbi:hypothetical protein RF11_03075 [Thelohanellus kitauei]|uniref:Uncharacterized protein n=1 Tax=Thelohanellus kitauei TaxID=669202 RepID=A0A0C2NEK9_THEKT|nr:hypothetical protein RF11_03075 [Thelohanellus kitauei]
MLIPTEHENLFSYGVRKKALNKLGQEYISTILETSFNTYSVRSDESGNKETDNFDIVLPSESAEKFFRGAMIAIIILFFGAIIGACFGVSYLMYLRNKKFFYL